jgi:hypothetical protein
MYFRHYQHPHRNDQRFIGFGLPFVGGLLGGLLGSAIVTRPFWGYPPIYPYGFYPYGGYPVYPGAGFQNVGGYPGVGYPGQGYPVPYPRA